MMALFVLFVIPPFCGDQSERGEQVDVIFHLMPGAGGQSHKIAGSMEQRA
jgi:hypothetical protein